MRKLKLFMAACALITGGMTVSAQNAGTYYIQNVSTGKWLGPGNNWGTQASLLNHADYWKLAQNDGAYTLESVVSNGGQNYYLNGSYCDGGATNFTFTRIEGKENTYSISNASGNYLTSNGTTVDMSATDGSAEVSQWKLWSENDMSSGMSNASVENPFDATYLIKDHDLGRNNRDYSAWSNTEATAPKTSDNPEGGSSRYSIEAYKKTFDVNQTISVPNGVYAIRVNGFYRQDGNDSNLPYVYANDSKATLPARTGSENSMQAAAVSFEAGNYLSDPAYVQVTNGTLKVGVATIGTSCWSIFKNFHLAYYGNVTLADVLLHEYVVAYSAALEEAMAYQDDDMFESDKNTLNTTINDNTIDLNGTVTEEQLTAATNNLKAASAAAEKAKVKYVAYNNIVAAVTGNANVNITSHIANLGFEDGTLNAWTSDNGGAIANNSNFSGKVDSYFVERWQNGVALSNGSLAHDVISLPKGVYTITANAQNIEQYNNNAAGTGYFLKVGSEQKEIGANSTYSITVKFTNEVNDVTLAFVLNNCTGNWISCDNIQITYDGEDFPAVTLVTGKMNANVEAAQTAAKEAYDSEPNVTNYNALVNAVAAAQASADAYAKMKFSIDKIDAALTAANTATASADTYNTIKTGYTNGTIADADIQAQISAAYEAVIPVIKSQTAASADFTLAIQNQSFEYGDMTGWTTAGTSSDTGVRETSNPTYAATGSDGYYLFNTWWQGVPLTQTIENLPNGEYTLTASVSSDGATIYLIANGEHNDGTETDVNEGGSYPSSNVLQEAAFTFLVKDGKATIGVVGGADGTAGEHKDYVPAGYWWYKADNFRLVKTRDLTEEEMAVAPTAIALKNGEEVVTEVALDATTNTVTLIPSYTPANATEGYITWTSSDEDVATVTDGVVTGVAPGTATITATSTLDDNVKAEVTITVTYPESEYASEKVTNDGATRSTITLGENIIKNGSFEYPDAFYGWTSGTGSKLTSSSFSIQTSGAYSGSNYLKASLDKGQADAGSIYTSWPVEAGKTYLFSYQMKNSSAISNDDYIRTSLSATTAEDATSYNETFKAVSCGTEWTELSYEFTVPEGKNYLVFSARWLKSSKSFDNFYLCEVQSKTTVGNVDYAKEAIPTANIGTGAFQYSQDAIDAANALVQGTATVEDVESAYEAVTTLNVPEATQAYNLVFSCEGHSATGNALTLIPNPNQTQGLYGLKYLTPANVNLAQAFYFVHTTGNKYKVFAVDTDGKDRYITTQAEGYGTTWYEGIRTIDDASKAMEIEIRPNGEGLYLLWNTGANKPLAHNGNNNNDMFTNNTANFQFVETTKPSITINTTAAGWGTTILPFAVATLPEGVKAYTCAATEGSTLTLDEVNALEANKPYIIEGSWNETLTGDAQGTALNYKEGLLTGTYEKIAAPNGSYILQKQGNKVGFFQVDTEKATPNVPANRAYLTDDNAGARAAYFLADNDATGISAIEGLTAGEATIYNVNGVQQQRLQKGMNIIVTRDGRSHKVMVK